MSMMGSLETLLMVLNRMFNSVCQDEGYNELTVNNYQYLLAVHLLKGPTVTQLSNYLGVRKASVTNMVDSLVSKGFVVRQPDEEDRRVTRVRLSPKGEEMMAFEDRVSEEFVRRFCSVLTSEEQATLERLLEKVAKGAEG